MAHRVKQETWLQKPEWLSIPLLPGAETSRALCHNGCLSLCECVYTSSFTGRPAGLLSTTQKTHLACFCPHTGVDARLLLLLFPRDLLGPAVGEEDLCAHHLPTPGHSSLLSLFLLRIKSNQ